MEISVSLDLKVKGSDIDDIMLDALGGAISYWCDEVEILGKKLGEYAGQQISLGGELEFVVEGERYILNQNKFLKGLAMYIERCPGCITDKKTIDTGVFDDICVDMTIQYALFEDIIYG
jgi:hypothetical protein